MACLVELVLAVFNGSKILIWKQITTASRALKSLFSCIQWFKDTNLKANHNRFLSSSSMHLAVFNGSKILIWKQITTIYLFIFCLFCCIQWFKDTNLKANHNQTMQVPFRWLAVFNGSKILIWKQITTDCYYHFPKPWLYSMVQRY